MYVSRLKMFSAIAFAVTAIISLPSNAFAAGPTATTSVALQATLNESISISSTVSTVTFSLTNGATSNGNAPVPISTSWVLGPGRTKVLVYGYFANAAQALTDGYSTPDYITSANVLGQVSGANSAQTTYAAFTQTNPLGGGAGAALLLVSQAIASGNFVGNSTNNLSLQIATPAQLPAGTYNGTLTLQAQAN